VLPYPVQMSLTLPLRSAAYEKDPTAFQPMFAGQSAALARPLPAGELVRSLARDADELLARLAGGDPA
jgi:nitronate monooxygenase